jgi:hypothetical protein
MVSLFLYIKNQHDQLINCLNSLNNQKDHQFELHLCLDGTNQSLNELIQTYRFNQIKAVYIHKTDSVIGCGYFYHQAKNIADQQYV